MGIQSIPQSSPLADLGDNLNATVQNGMQLILKLAIEQRRTQRKEAFKELDRRERLFREENKSQLDEVNKQQRAMRKGISVIEGLPKGKITDVDRAEIEDALTAYFGGGKAAQERAEKLVSKYGKGFLSRDSSLINNVKEKILPILNRGEERTSDYKTAYHNLIAEQRFNTPIDEEVERLRALREPPMPEEEAPAEPNEAYGKEWGKWKEGALAPLGNMLESLQAKSSPTYAVGEDIPEGEARIFQTPFGPPVYMIGKADAEKIESAPSLADKWGVPTAASVQQAREARGEPDVYKGQPAENAISMGLRRIWERQLVPGMTFTPGVLGSTILGEATNAGLQKAGVAPEKAESVGDTVGNIYLYGGGTAAKIGLRALERKTRAARAHLKRRTQEGVKSLGEKAVGASKKVGETTKNAFKGGAFNPTKTRMTDKVTPEQTFFERPRALRSEEAFRKFSEKEKRRVPQWVANKYERDIHNQAAHLADSMVERANPVAARMLKENGGSLERTVAKAKARYEKHMSKVDKSDLPPIAFQREPLLKVKKILGTKAPEIVPPKNVDYRLTHGPGRAWPEIAKEVDSLSGEGALHGKVDKITDALMHPNMKLTPSELHKLNSEISSKMRELEAAGKSGSLGYKALAELKDISANTYYRSLGKKLGSEAKNVDEMYGQVKNLERYMKGTQDRVNKMLDLFTSPATEKLPQEVLELKKAVEKFGGKPAWERVRVEAFKLKSVADSMQPAERFRLIRALTTAAIASGAGSLFLPEGKGRKSSRYVLTGSGLATMFVYAAAFLNYKRHFQYVRNPKGPLPLSKVAKNKTPAQFNKAWDDFEKIYDKAVAKQAKRKKP